MDTHFFKSTYSGGNQSCVEVAHRDDIVLIRDSKYTGPADDQPILSVTAAQWPIMLDLALSRMSGKLGDTMTVTVHHDGGATIIGPGITGQRMALVYTADEWDAFAKGIADGQFDRR
ncbi:DUF397 domain-containing protein [Nocardia nepalensis]|uniref:DUF397 domain-containing protein n=1 Tax=Nocardia nepalensis TaxID=3375448 RepID=UPI003B672107